MSYCMPHDVAPLPSRTTAQYLRFTLGGEDYGLDILRVREIRGWSNVRALPDTADYIKGMLDLRGSIVPIVDLRVRFHLTPAEYTPTTVVIIVSVVRAHSNQMLGLVVDGVSDVLEVSIEQVQPAPSFGYHISPRFIQGMVTAEAQMVVLLDADYLLNPEELHRLLETD